MASETEEPVALKTFVYPFQKTETPLQGPPKAVEFVDPQTYYTALASAEDGFYPIGANGQWHGGIHFGSQTGSTLAQDAGIRCVADGEVIAYRVDSVYPTVAYTSCGAATYSTGFVLVRHRLQLPPAPATPAAATAATPAVAAPATPAAEAAAPAAPATAPAAATAPATPATSTPAQEPSLILYSLYMHLLHWKAYQDDAAKPRPKYWSDANTFIVAGKAVDLDFHSPATDGRGMNVRKGNSGGTDLIGWLPPGSRLTVKAGEPGWREIVSIDSGEMSPNATHVAAADAPLGWTFTKELDSAPAEPKVTDAIHVLDTPLAVKAGDLMGHLGQYQRYSDMGPMSTSCVERPLVQLDVFSGDDVDAFLTKSRARAAQLPDSQRTLLFVETGATLAQPTAPDQKTLDGEGVAVDATSPKTGEWAKVQKGPLQIVAKGTLPAYDAATGRYANGQVLARILDDRGSAIEQAAYNALNAAGKSVYTQREVMLPGGEPVWVQRSMLGTGPVTRGYEMDVWSQFPLQVTDTSGPQTAYPRVAAIKTLTRSALEADGMRWWEVIVGDSDGNRRSGCARETGQPKVRLCTPWDWPGFEVVAVDSTTPQAFYANHIASLPNLSATEQAAVQTQGASFPSAPLFDKLYAVIDSDHDNVLTPTEIRAALQKPWLAQAISRLITRYDSEWSGPMSKWDAIDPLIPEASQDDWAKEKKRIETLLWWDGVTGKHGFPENPAVTHFHPVGLIANFSGACDCFDIETFITKYRLLHSKSFGWYEDRTKVDIPALSEASVVNLRHLLDGIKAKFIPKYGCNVPHIAYMLATSRIESYAFWIAEFFGPTSEQIGYAQAEIDYGIGPTARRRDYAKRMGQSDVGDGYKYRGRGIVQITWKGKYKQFEDHLSIDLVSRPELALQWDIALDIMIEGMVHGYFTGVSLSDRITATNKNYVCARNILNGSDKQHQFADYAEQFEIILMESGAC